MAFQTIIQFAYIEFDKNWDQVPGGLLLLVYRFSC
jgi:hypothetical protein